MLLQLTDGITTITLSGTAPVLGCTYYPQTPQRQRGELQSVTETAEVNLRGTAAAMRATINDIETLLTAAAARQASGMGERVFVLYKPVDTDAAAYRSEVLDGRLLLDAEPMLRRFGDANPTIRIGIVWTRAAWWEGAETELELSANGQAAGTGGKTVYNDPANGNWVDVAATQVGGVLPAPIRLQLINTTGGTRSYRRLMVGVNAYSTPASLVHFLQAEGRIAGGTIAADATSSGGNRLDFTLTSSPTVFSWTLPAADLQRARGRSFRILARFPGAAGSVYVRPQIRNASNVVLWEGDELALTMPIYESWQDLGVVPLPPGGYGSAFGAMRLSLSLRGSGVTQLDVLQLTALDSYRQWELVGTGIAVGANQSIVLDGIDGLAYVLSGTARVPLPVAVGAPLMLQPGLAQRLYVLHQINANQTGGAGDAPIDATMSVRAWHRPRRVTV